MKPWLWPDRVIGKRESRSLREEHNRLVNAAHEMRVLLERVTPLVEDAAGVARIGGDACGAREGELLRGRILGILQQTEAT